MSPAFSAYLDAVRFMAAVTVVISHFTFAQFTGGVVPYQGSLAGAAVTVFFVLSGYVIAYVANEKEKTLKEFAISRCARIYSVAIPALVLTIAVDMFLLSMNAGENIPLYEYRGFWKYLPVFLTFTNEVAGLHIVVLTNGVFWSLSYEVWYYITFAVAFYLSGWQRNVGVTLCLIILGIPALVYFPLWLAGCGIYYLHKRTTISKPLARAIAALTIAALVAIRVTGFDDYADMLAIGPPGNEPYALLHNSVHYVNHYMVGILIALNFYAVRYCDLRVLTYPSVGKWIAYAASFTFAIYLSHRPFMGFWAHVTGHDPNSAVSVAMLFVLVMFSTFLFGQISENRKKDWKAFFRWVFSRMDANLSWKPKAG